MQARRRERDERRDVAVAYRGERLLPSSGSDEKDEKP